jgi:hypothetical protein
MSQFYKIHLVFSRGCFEAIFVKNTLGCLGVKDRVEMVDDGRHTNNALGVVF